MRLPVPGDPTTDDTWGETLNELLADLAGRRLAPASPHAKDDEFDGTSTASWSATPTAPTATDVDTTSPNALYVHSTSGNPLAGRLQAVPSGAFTITTRVLDPGGFNLGASGVGEHARLGGLVLTNGTSAASSAHYVGIKITSGVPAAARIVMTLGGTFTSQTLSTPVGWSPYFKMTWTGTQIVWSHSIGGHIWRTPEAAVTPAFTPTHMGLVMNNEGALTDASAAFEFFRVT